MAIVSTHLMKMSQSRKSDRLPTFKNKFFLQICRGGLFIIFLGFLQPVLSDRKLTPPQQQVSTFILGVPFNRPLQPLVLVLPLPLERFRQQNLMLVVVSRILMKVNR